MYCKDLRQILDSYISDELLVETNHDVLRHLEDCADCRRELAARRDLRLHLRHVVLNADVNRIDPVFASRLKNELRAVALRPGGIIGGFDLGRIFNPRNLTLAFGCLLILGFGGLLIFDGTNSVVLTANTKTASATDPTYDIAAAVRASWQELTNQAVGDHENCAIEYHLKEDPITLDEAAKTYGGYYKDLDKVVEVAMRQNGGTPSTVKFLESHMCIFEGRRFAHIVFKKDGKILSVIVTDTDLPAGRDDVMTAQYDANTSASGVHFGHYAMYVVSDLPAASNELLAKQIAPAVRLHTEKLRA